MNIVAVTACPTGIAHTYMAAEALERAAKKLGYKIKVETQGAMGVENRISKAEIVDADLVIFAVDVSVKEESRFKEKPTFKIERFRQLEIVDIISFIALEEKSLGDIDIIISTVPIKSSVPVLIISPILTQNDIKRLDKFIDNFENTNNKQNYLEEIFDQDLLFLNKKISSKEGAIRFLCNELIKRDIVEEPYLASMLQREKMSSTEVGSGVAIPHGEPKFVRNSRLALLTLNETLVWDD